MISQAAAIGSRTALITNGTLLTPHLIDALVESGLDKLWISADSSHQEAFIQSPSQENQPVLMDLLPELFISGNGSLQKLETGLALVLTRDNQAEILEIIDQGQSLGLSSFYLTYLEAYTQYQASQLPYSLEELRRQGTRQIRADNMLPKIKAMTGKNPGLSIEGVVTKNQDRCPFAERGDLVLRWDGEISPCLPLLYTHTTHIESWEYKQFAFSLGNILDHSIPEIWEDKEYSRLQERLLHNEFSPCLGCRDCWFSQDNLQDCMGFDHPACGGCLWAAGLVSCP
jgi:MoaA/NifB/PqqE/SkfB family radical SAM enzyme